VEPRIRAGGLDDLAAVAALHALSRRTTYQGIIPAWALRATTAAELRRTWARRVARESGTHRLFLAETGGELRGGTGGELRGFSYVGPGDDIERVPPDTGVLYAIHVHPAAKGRGIGSALMERCLRTFAEWQCARAVLWVVEGNDRARRFYERTGWRHDGTVRESPVGNVITRQLRYVRSVGDPLASFRQLDRGSGRNQ
jgi:ribosomal protein S18 acetylase RimI-like enzyme